MATSWPHKHIFNQQSLHIFYPKEVQLNGKNIPFEWGKVFILYRIGCNDLVCYLLHFDLLFLLIVLIVVAYVSTSSEAADGK